MSRCRAWRFADKPGHPFGHEPGTCRKCWKPCFNKVPGDGPICDTCIEMFSTHLDPKVRLALIKLDPPDDVLRLMATDLDSSVATAAEKALAEHLISAA